MATSLPPDVLPEINLPIRLHRGIHAIEQDSSISGISSSTEHNGIIQNPSEDEPSLDEIPNLMSMDLESSSESCWSGMKGDEIGNGSSREKSTGSAEPVVTLGFGDQNPDESSAGIANSAHLSTKDDSTNLLEANNVEPLTLQNVGYISSMEMASDVNDMSTMGEPITKKMAQEVFFRRTLPAEIPIVDNTADDISSLNDSTHKRDITQDCTEGDDEETALPTNKCSENTGTIYRFQARCAVHTKLEWFFVFLIAASAIGLTIFLTVVFSS